MTDFVVNVIEFKIWSCSAGVAYSGLGYVGSVLAHNTSIVPSTGNGSTVLVKESEKLIWIGIIEIKNGN